MIRNPSPKEIPKSEERIRILIVEDVETDAELEVAALQEEGLEPAWKRVETREEFIRELTDFAPDLILSDYQLPTFDGMQALQLAKALAPKIPFLIVTGSTNEETAVECMKAGADDYLIKEHLQRLALAARSALRAKEEQNARRLAEEALNLRNSALEAAANAFVITNRDGEIQWVNPAFTEMTGYGLEEVVGRNPRVLKSGIHREGFYKQLWDTIKAGRTWRGEIQNRRKDGTLYTEEMTITPVRAGGAGITHFVAVKQDVTARKWQEEEIHRLATLDPLTRLPNRDVLLARVGDAVFRAQRGHPGALLVLDLDGFRVVNDSEGHGAGDQLLLLLAERLGASLRPGDLLARIGGDEFAVLLEDVETAGARQTAENLRAVVAAQRLNVGDHVYDLTASVGVCLIDGTASAESVVARADAAMFAAKDLGKNRTAVWDAELERRPQITEATRWVARVKDALKEDRLLLHFQAIVHLATGRADHHEALVRMWGEDGTLDPPGAFLPPAERFGLMPAVDRRVIELALSVLEARPEARLFVNLSASGLADESLLGWIEASIREARFSAGRLTFEITETTAVADVVSVQRWIRRLAELGCGFAIDDFGTGFSSFGYLRSLPVDYVKIDGSFIGDLDIDLTNHALVQAMVSVGHALGKIVIAEMVETASVATVLRELGVDYGQGWLWGRAGPWSASLNGPFGVLPGDGDVA